MHGVPLSIHKHAVGAFLCSNNADLALLAGVDLECGGARERQDVLAVLDVHAMCPHIGQIVINRPNHHFAVKRHPIFFLQPIDADAIVAHHKEPASAHHQPAHLDASFAINVGEHQLFCIDDNGKKLSGLLVQCTDNNAARHLVNLQRDVSVNM